MKARISIITVLCALSIAIGCICASAAYAADNYNYVDENGNTHEVGIYDDVITEYDSTYNKLGDSFKETWYILDGKFTFKEEVWLSGTVNLVLCDGADVKYEGGLVVEEKYGERNKLVIWGESAEGGKLTAKAEYGDAAIGSRSGEQCGTIEIHSGEVHAETEGAVYVNAAGAAIGSGRSGKPGTINIYGGKVTANGGYHAAGIGGGDEVASGEINITGGNVTAKALEYGAAIGSGDEASYENPGKITISGGKVRAYGGIEAAGIGGGNDVSGGEILIKGTADVIAEGGDESRSQGGAAGIGGGDNSGCGEVIIESGNVTVTGGTYGAGIGSGDEAQGKKNVIKISGGVVNATAGGNGAAIGGGNETDGGKIYISGGNVTAEGEKNKDSMLDGGAGIGGGDGAAGGEVYISGGIVDAHGGPWAAGIGGGYEGAGGTIEISGKADVTAVGNHRGAGIGSGQQIDPQDEDVIFGGTIRIYGGTVKATGGNTGNYGEGGAGIGSGERHMDDSIAAKVEIIEKDGNKIYVEAQGGVNSSGIGAGDGGNGADVTIDMSDQSTVIAKGGEGGAGIGSANNGKKTGTVKIKGGNVKAYGGARAAGIGGGDDTNFVGSLTIDGGNVYAKAGKCGAGIGAGDCSNQEGTITINGGEVEAIGSDGGAGIGAGDEMWTGEGGEGGPVVINGGTVVASSTDSKAMPIGNGEDGDEDCSLTIYEKASVSGGVHSGAAFLVEKKDRISTCHRTDYNYVKIEPCTHYETAYIQYNWVDHQIVCKYCELVRDEGHDFFNKEFKCTKCGFEGAEMHFSPGLFGRGAMNSEIVGKDNTYTLPDCGFEGDEGKYFAVWQYKKNDGSTGYRVAGDTIDVGSDMEFEAVWEDRPLFGVIVDQKLDNGTISIERTNRLCIEGDTVTLKVTPDEGYALEELSVTEKESGDPVDVMRAGPEEYFAFKMPADYVKVTATFKKITGKAPIKLKAKGKNGLVMSWSKMNVADGYEIYLGKQGKKCKLIKTVKTNKTTSLTKKGLKKGKLYKAYVKAYINRYGEKEYVFTTPASFAYVSGSSKYTNVKSVGAKASVSLNAGETYKVKASVKKLKASKKLVPSKYVAKLRYMSSNDAVAEVSSKGTIKAVGAGTCYVYAYAHNGVAKKIKVTVK